MKLENIRLNEISQTQKDYILYGLIYMKLLKKAKSYGQKVNQQLPRDGGWEQEFTINSR